MSVNVSIEGDEVERVTGGPVSRETLRVLVDEANHWQRAYDKARLDLEEAEAVVERQREALAEAIRFLEDVAPPKDTTRNRISAALMCLRETLK